jgi:hypothetical protein
LRRVIVAATLVAALAVALPVVAGASHNPNHPGGPPELTLNANPNPTVYRGPTVLSGRLRAPGSDAGRTITLRADRYPFNGGRPVATTVTDASGRYAFGPRRPPKNTNYRTVFGNLRSSLERVRVRLRVSFRLSDDTPMRGQRVRFSGRVCPTHDGRLVAIQKRTATGAWVDVRRTFTTDAIRCSIYVKRIRLFNDNVFRVVVRRHVDHARGISATRTVDVGG